MDLPFDILDIKKKVLWILLILYISKSYFLSKIYWFEKRKK